MGRLGAGGRLGPRSHHLQGFLELIDGRVLGLGLGSDELLYRICSLLCSSMYSNSITVTVPFCFMNICSFPCISLWLNRSIKFSPLLFMWKNTGFSHIYAYITAHLHWAN